MGQRPVVITGLWPIPTNKEEIISSLFVTMGQRPVVITGLWPTPTNEEEIIVCFLTQQSNGMDPLLCEETDDNFLFIYVNGSNPRS